MKLEKRKEWTFTITVREGNDEWWETRPTKPDVRREIEAALLNNGFYDCNVK